MLHLSAITTIVLLAAQSAALSLRRFDSTEAFYQHDPTTPPDCTLWWNSDDGLSCDTVLLIAGVSISQLTAMNPSIKSCSDWKTDYSYCIKAVSSTPSPVTTTSKPPGTSSMTTSTSMSTSTSTSTSTSKSTTTTTTTSKTTTTPTPTPSPTTPSNGVQTPQPPQPGMVTNCNRFYKVVAGDTCAIIATKVGVTVTQLATWNTAIGGTACTAIWADYYICTAVIASSTTATPTATPISTPQPIQTGMVANCNRFYKVVTGDTCAIIAPKLGVTVAQLATWNTGIGGTACTNMWAGYYICTGISSGTSTTTPAATTTPQPVQTGMVANCKKFHFVTSGQTCAIISSLYGITVANFIIWNPAAGSGCTGLWANTYACVGL